MQHLPKPSSATHLADVGTPRSERSFCSARAAVFESPCATPHSERSALSPRSFHSGASDGGEREEVLDTRGAAREILVETLEQRRALDEQLEELRAQLRECEQKRASLSKAEAWQRMLLREGTSPKNSPRNSQMPANQPMVFDLGDVSAQVPVQLRRRSTELPPVELVAEPENSGGEAEEDDWERGLEALGVVKCHLCGMKLASGDEDAIEEHTRVCEGAKHCLGPAVETALPSATRCTRCGELVALNVDAIEQHSRICRAADDCESSGRRASALQWLGLTPR